MKTLKTLAILMAVPLMLFFVGCQDQQQNDLNLELQEKESEIKTASLEQPVVNLTYTNEDGAEVILEGTPSVGEVEENSQRSLGPGCGSIFALKKGEFRTCCIIDNFIRPDPTNNPNGFTFDLGRAWAFEATSWVFRFQVFFDGDELGSVDFPDPWLGSRCNDMGSFQLGFDNNFNPQAGICCPAEYTIVISRLYTVNFGDTLFTCCSESITYPYIGPRTGNPCC